LAEAVAAVAVPAVEVVPAAEVVVDRVVWVAPRQPGQVATACAQIAATKCPTWQGSHAIR